MVDPLVARRKLQKITLYLRELQEMADTSLEDYLRDFRHRRTVERLIQAIVDAAVDLNVHAVIDAGNPAPEDAYNSFLAAAKTGLLSQVLAGKLAPATGERNIIVHKYEEMDDLLIFESISEIVALFKEYVGSVDRYLTKAGGKE